MTPIKSVVIAGTGYTGLRVFNRLDPAAVMAVSRSPLPGFETVLFDLDSETTPTGHPTGIYSIVYTIPPARNHATEVRLGRFLQWLAIPPSRFIYISTSAVYGDAVGALVDERAAVAPGNSRSRLRLAAEQSVQEYADRHGCDAIILRVPAIYGPGRLGLQRIKIAAPLISEADSQAGNRIHVDDLAACCEAALSDDVDAGIYNIGDSDFRSSTWFAHAVADIAGLPRRPEVSRDDAVAQFSDEQLSYIKESRRLDNRKMLGKLLAQLTYADTEDGIRASLADDN